MFYSNEYMISVETESTVPMQDLRDALQQACDAGAEFQFRILATQAPSFIVLFWRDASEDEEYIAKRMTAQDEEALATAAFQQLADELREPGIDMLADLVQQLAEGRAEFIHFGSLDEVKPMPEEEGSAPDTSGATTRSGDGKDRGHGQVIEYTQETMLDAAYLMQGYRSKHGSSLQTIGESSELDTVAELVGWAPKLNDIYSQLARLDIYPTGVFAYEIAEELGAAIGDMVKAAGVWPEDKEIWTAALPLFISCYRHEDMLTDVQCKFDFTLERATGLKPAHYSDESGPHAEDKAAEAAPSSTTACRSDDVPVTEGLVAVVAVIQQAAVLYRSESSLAEHFKLQSPPDWISRCETLFYSVYAEQAKAAGLKLNTITFEAIAYKLIPEKVLNTNFEELPKKWVFNPYTGWQEVNAGS